MDTSHVQELLKLYILNFLLVMEKLIIMVDLYTSVHFIKSIFIDLLKFNYF